MAAARKAAGFNTLTAASNDYGQTTPFNLRDLVKECELSVAAGFAIDVDTQLPNASKNLLDFEFEVCSQHEKSGQTYMVFRTFGAERQQTRRSSFLFPSHPRARSMARRCRISYRCTWYIHDIQHTCIGDQTVLIFYTSVVEFLQACCHHF